MQLFIGRSINNTSHRLRISKMDISSATALVTGANRGLGRAIIDRLLAKGAIHIYATARTPAEAEMLSSVDRRVTGLVLDITDEQLVREAAARATDVNLLINNAGILNPGSFLETERAQIERIFATNFYGSLAMTTAFVPVLEANGGGTVVNILTVAALASMPWLSAYNASKAAGWSMTQSLRATLGKKNIRVMGVFPGPVDTDMMARVQIPKSPPAAVAEAILAGVASDLEDVFPDNQSAQVYEQWKQDPKAVERQFAAM
jgi:NAD(P)-dependent dehydrogenase (short-subunit alcohol dehydrogenase family)